jgi:hypothetical protein
MDPVSIDRLVLISPLHRNAQRQNASSIRNQAEEAGVGRRAAIARWAQKAAPQAGMRMTRIVCKILFGPLTRANLSRVEGTRELENPPFPAAAGGFRMSDTFRTTDPMITAAAAIRRGGDLAPLLLNRLPELLPNYPFHRLPELISRLAGTELSEPETIRTLRRLLDEIEMATRGDRDPPPDPDQTRSADACASRGEGAPQPRQLRPHRGPLSGLFRRSVKKRIFHNAQEPRCHCTRAPAPF